MGLWWAKIKVNDLDGNPIEIASVVVWRVVDTAHASFAVEDYVGFVQMQAESALRNLDEERKAQRVSNLLVVLCGERSTQPVINAGTIY